MVKKTTIRLDQSEKEKEYSQNRYNKSCNVFFHRMRCALRQPAVEN